MKSTSGLTLAAATALLAASNVLAGTQTSEGCFSSSTGLTLNTTDATYNSKGSCGTDSCLPLGYSVFATSNSSACWCGNELPPANSKVDSSWCNITCPGYPSDICGGSTLYWSVYLTGLTTAVSNAASDTSSSTDGSSTASSTTSAKPSVVTVGGQTVVVTASSSTSSSATSSASSSSSGHSKAGIAAGVVVGLVAIAAIAGGVFLFMRNRRRREIEEEHRRNAAVSSFIAGGGSKHPPTSSGSGSFSDMRLDPVMAQRRMSDGSIADNEDYSRRILKVTNA